jgi:hypothetical protein
MKTDFRNRAFLPVVMPLAILGGIAVVVGIFAVILLYLTRETAVMFAIVAAAGIFVAVALAASQDRLDTAKKGAIGIAAGVPILLGAMLAGGLLGGIADENRMINIEPHEQGMLLADAPPDAPLLAAESINAFCLPTGGGCEETNEWSVEWDDPEEFVYAFDNRHVGTQHNLVLYDAAAEYDGEAIGLTALTEEMLISPEFPPTFAGPELQAYGWPRDENGVPQEFYFVCTIHPTTMYGLGTLAE